MRQDALPSASDGLGGSAPDGPESVSIESVQESVSSSRARKVCEICGNNWPAEYGTDCHKCSKKPKLSTWTPADDRPACTCGTAYRNSYGRRCVECTGEPSAAQRDALREKDGGGGARKGGGVDGGGADPSVPETDERAETADQPRSEPGPRTKRSSTSNSRSGGSRGRQHDGHTEIGSIDDDRKAQGNRAD